MSIEDKYDEVQQLITIGKEKGYLLYDEVNDLLPRRHHLVGRARRPVQHVRQRRHRGRRLGPEVPRTRRSRRATTLELDLTPGALDKTNDPVRMYLREMGTVPLLTREGEVEIAKRIERGKLAVIKSISRTPIVAPEGHRARRRPQGGRAHDPRAGDLQRRGDHRRAARGARARGPEADRRRSARRAQLYEKAAGEARRHAEEGQAEVPPGALEGHARAHRGVAARSARSSSPSR